MNILGLNEGHMCSAAIIQNGKLLAAACEERFTRNKNEHGYPENAIQYCLEAANLKNNDIDFIATATLELPAVFEATARYSKFTIEDYVKENHEYWKPILIDKKEADYLKIFKKIPNKHYDFSFMEKEHDTSKWPQLFREERLKNLMRHFQIQKEKIFFVDHHTGHAYYAYFMSPFRKNVLIVTADAWGDGVNCSISVGTDNDIEMKFKSPNNNLARLYKYITLLLGMKPNEHEYKVMGLAPYSTDYQLRKPYEIFKNTLQVDGLDFKYNEKPTDSYYWFKEKLEGHRFDGIAGGLQKYVEEIMETWIKNIIQVYPSDTLVLSGGLALNIKINKRLAEIPGIKHIFVPGGGGDESQSIGAALFVANTVHENMFEPPMHDYLGPVVNSDEVEKILEKMNSKSDFIIKNNFSNSEIAQYLKNDLIVARCSGRSEFGPRALGNRSILANPSNAANVRKINNQIKYRDFWMPFTPSILIERISDYVINPKNIHSPFMTIAFESTDLARKHLIGAIHPSDFTIRPQFVERKYNPGYHDLISEFEKLTGIGALLNTSLNLHGEPVVGSTTDAIHTLINSELDVMIIENTLLVRRRSI